MNSWRILCEECDNETHVVAEEYLEISFCPVCGRRTEPELIPPEDSEEPI